MKDKLGAVGVSGRDPADVDDDYILEQIKIGTIVYLAAGTRSQVATTQHGDHGFPKCLILCPDIRDPIECSSTISKRCDNTAITPAFFLNFQAQMTKGMAAYGGQGL